MELWAVIDAEGEYDEVYNRYAHMVITLINGESYPELLQTDAIRLNLNYRDIRKLGIEYIASPNPIQDNEGVALELVYSESNGYIYHVAN